MSTVEQAVRQRAHALVTRRTPRASTSTEALRTLLGHRPARLVVLVITGLLAGLAEAGILAVVAEVAAALVNGHDTVRTTIGPAHVRSGIGVMLVLAAAMACVRLVLGVAAAYLPARIVSDTQASLRRRLFAAYSRASWTTQAAERDGRLQELLTRQIGSVSTGTIAATKLISGSLTFATLVAAAFVLSPIAAVLVLVVAAALFGLMRPLGNRGRYHGRMLSAAQLDYGGSIGEAVRLAEETYTFGTAAAGRARVEERIEAARHQLFRRQLAGGLVTGLYLGLVILLLVGGLAGLYLSGTGQIASLGAVVLMLVRSATYGQQAQGSWQQVQQVAPYVDRLASAEERYRASAASVGVAPFPREGAIRLRSVSFGYVPGVPVLTNVNVEIRRGTAVGIAGRTGTGKSTLVQLLLRMRTPTGSYLVGDTPAEEIEADAWSRHVAYVPQEPRLLHATVAGNIRFFRDIDDVAIERAARLAHIHDEIAAMPARYDTMIGQRADAVSGGQRQRICLARALAGNPSVLVLDEPTSALDLASETAIQHSLASLKGDLTLIVVSHRPSLLEMCDQIVRVKEGSAKPDILAASSMGSR